MQAVMAESSSSLALQGQILHQLQGQTLSAKDFTSDEAHRQFVDLRDQLAASQSEIAKIGAIVEISEPAAKPSAMPRKSLYAMAVLFLVITAILIIGFARQLYRQLGADPKHLAAV